ncbi:hypothetical protein MKEN_01151900 [Mycena kentingensis (nom. inval.)]|nr:hypothetical protein MKEN_01151900 [Mycena kentingensis (nom. inval.)]
MSAPLRNPFGQKRASFSLPSPALVADKVKGFLVPQPYKMESWEEYYEDLPVPDFKQCQADAKTRPLDRPALKRASVSDAVSGASSERRGSVSSEASTSSTESFSVSYAFKSAAKTKSPSLVQRTVFRCKLLTGIINATHLRRSLHAQNVLARQERPAPPALPMGDACSESQYLACAPQYDDGRVYLVLPSRPDLSTDMARWVSYFVFQIFEAVGLTVLQM